MKDWRPEIGRKLSAAVCEVALGAAIEPMRMIAREHGYTLALHGSLARDIDMVAVPWRERASDPEELMADLKGLCVGIFSRARLDPKEGWTEKPHGRLAKSIHCFCDGHFFYFDISIMPRAPKPEEDE